MFQRYAQIDIHKEKIQKSQYLTKNKSENSHKKKLSIAIPDDNKNELADGVLKSEESDFKQGEENLAPSSEKKRSDKVLNGDKIPKTGGMKTGTHLGQNSSSKNIFLNKF